MRYDVELIVSSQKFANDYTLNIKVISAAAIGDTTIVVGINYGNEPLVEVGSRLLIVTTGQLVTLVARENLVDDEWLLTIDEPLTGALAPLATIRVLSLSTTKHVLELYENETISQTWQFSDLQTFSALGSFSREFRVPATRANCDAMGYLQDPNWSELIDYFQVKLDAELRVQTLPLARGYIRVGRVITQADKLADFELTFYSEAPDLFSKLGSKKLKDIAALTSLNAVLDYDEVINATGYPYLYSLSDYGQKWSEAGEAGTRSIYDESVTGCVRAGDLTPSMSWGWIFEQILKEAGFEYEAVDLINILNQYYAPWINTKALTFTASEQGALFKYYLRAAAAASTGFVPLPFVTEEFDNGNNVVGSTFTAPASGIFYFRVWATINNTAAVSSLNIAYRNLTQGDFVEVINQTIPIGVTNYDSANSFVGITAQAGDQITFWFRSAAGVAATFLGGASYSGGTGVELYDVNFTDNLVLNWAANAPDILQADFLRDVFNMHCCVIVPDRNVSNLLLIRIIKDYIGSGVERDWSRKLDISKDIVLSNTSDFQYKELTFTYSEGEDVASQIYKGLGRIYGDYKINGYTVTENDVPTDFARDGEQAVQLTSQSTPCNYINGTSVIIPKFVDENGEFVSPKLRCLFHAGDYPLYLWITAGNFPDTAYVVPVLNHYEFSIPSFSQRDLNWAPEQPIQLIQSNPINNLFNLYWRDYLNGLYSPQARVLEAYFALDLADIQSFTFADLVWVKNAWWRILKIEDFKIGVSDTVKVTLIKYIEPGAETSAIPVGATAGGEVEFEDGAGNPISPTQSACERYGFVWDPVTQSCSASPVPPVATQRPAATKVGGSTREISNASNTIVMADKLDNAPTNQYTVAVGTNIKLETDNALSIAVGEKLTKLESGGVVMFGKNVQTNIPGVHFGGGYRLNDPANGILGFAQAGQFSLHCHPFITLGGIPQLLYIDGEDGRNITLEDNTLWSCLLNLTITDNTLTGYHVGQYSFGLYKVGGIAGVGAITTVAEDSALGTNVFTLDVDVISVTEQHRITVTPTGGTYPDQFYMVASIIYQQVRTS
jgi:hypothetical protein